MKAVLTSGEYKSGMRNEMCLDSPWFFPKWFILCHCICSAKIESTKNLQSAPKDGFGVAAGPKLFLTLMSPQAVESLVTLPLERSLSQMSGD